MGRIFRPTLSIHTISILTCILISFIVKISCQENYDSPQVEIESGKLVGTIFKTSGGRKGFAFKGVPYAAPPLNELRFKAPQPVAHWKDVREAIRSTGCLELDHYMIAMNKVSNGIKGDEDCLHLNIYTPNVCNGDEGNHTLFDVVVFIHGGAFMFGSGRPYQPTYLLDKINIVFVSINYRLGPFGFMTMEDDVIPGNIGLKDQLFALKWIHRNIRRFCGDPGKVTLTGMSAGGASVHYHLLSKESRNYFSKAISLSGTALCPWALMDNGRNKTLRLAEALNCANDNSTIVLKCLQNIQGHKILEPIKNLFMPWLYNPFSPFAPTVETTKNEAFLNEHPYKIIKSGGKVKDVPWLVSVTADEGLYPGAEFVSDDKLLSELNNRWYNIAPHLLDFNFTVSVNKRNTVSKLIREFYFSNSSISKSTRRQLIDMLSDRLFLTGTEKAVKYQAASMTSDVYFYKFSYRGKLSVSNALTKSFEDVGVSHADDLPYILGCFIRDIETRGDDRKVMEKMVNIWTSFIKYGKPDLNDSNIVWNPVSKSIQDNYFDYLDLRSHENIKIVSENNFGNKSFWDSLPLQENELSSTK